MSYDCILWNTLHWHHNGWDGISNHQPHDCLLNHLFRRKHQSSASLAFVQGIHQWPVNSLHKGPVTWKKFPFDDVIMKESWWVYFMNSKSRLHLFTSLIIVLYGIFFASSSLMMWPLEFIYTQHGNTISTQQYHTLIARFMGPAWGPPGANRTQVGPMLATWTLLFGIPAPMPRMVLWY